MAGGLPTDYCADLSVALHYYNAEDKWKDDRSLLGLDMKSCLPAVSRLPRAAGPVSAAPSAPVWTGWQNMKLPGAKIWMPCPAALAS